ncbi:MAG: Ribosome maturation factor RimM [Acidimicrobiales bacterium]|nr:MAG: ribosome maturation factor RimM [Actinomycetota bacterium]MBV6509197.1 Ribosome maturation factor RimM [Acidimicrobiales bacterium]RIK08458.1 MAG: ribosome maturation factor RimM [Acidobacteriota bacterium]
MSTSNSSSETPTHLLDVGRILKPHGLDGEVVVELSTNRLERAEPGSVFDTPAGSLTVRTSRPHRNRFIVEFEECRSRGEAERLRGVLLRAEALEDPDALWVHELIGSQVLTPDGIVRGVVESVQANPASDLLVLDSGALVPLRFVLGHPGGRSITVDPPEGLWEL